MDVDDLASLSLSLPSDGTDASADEQALSLLAAAGDKINGKANAKAKGGKNKRWVPSACKVCGIKLDDMPGVLETLAEFDRVSKARPISI